MRDIESAVQNFQLNFSEFKYLDVKTAILTAEEVGINEDRLFEMSQELAKEFGQENPVEPNFTIWNFICNDIRCQLYDKFGEDFEIEYYSNYMDSGFNLSDDELTRLHELYDNEETKEDYIDLILDNEIFSYFFDNCGL